jgi:hypothetical protein
MVHTRLATMVHQSFWICRKLRFSLQYSCPWTTCCCSSMPVHFHCRSTYRSSLRRWRCNCNSRHWRLFRSLAPAWAFLTNSRVSSLNRTESPECDMCNERCWNTSSWSLMVWERYHCISRSKCHHEVSLLRARSISHEMVHHCIIDSRSSSSCSTSGNSNSSSSSSSSSSSRSSCSCSSTIKRSEIVIDRRIVNDFNRHSIHYQTTRLTAWCTCNVKLRVMRL